MDHLFVEFAVVVYITYTMATSDFPDIYALAVVAMSHMRWYQCIYLVKAVHISC